MRYLTIIFILVLSGLFFLPSCTCYNSEFPLSDSKKSKIDPLILGQWISPDSNESMGFYIERFNNSEYIIALYEDNQRCIEDIYKGHITKIRDRKIMNVISLFDEYDEGYVFCTYRIVNDSLIVSLYCTTTESLVKKEIGSIRGHYKYFKKEMDKNILLDDEELILIRPKKTTNETEVIREMDK